jgi:hypothetical protein
VISSPERQKATFSYGLFLHVHVWTLRYCKCNINIHDTEITTTNTKTLSELKMNSYIITIHEDHRPSQFISLSADCHDHQSQWHHVFKVKVDKKAGESCTVSG